MQSLVKENNFVFDNDYFSKFRLIKEKFVTESAIIALNWDLPYELMCDANDYLVGAYV